MGSGIEWQEVATEYRETRDSAQGLELRWLVNRETTRDAATGLILTRGVLRHPGVCVVAPVLPDGRIVLMRQYRYSIDAELWELPAGTIDGREENGRMVARETPAACAARELQEETGYRAARLELLAGCVATPGISDELIHIFKATGLAAGERAPEPGELIREIRLFDPDQLAGMVARGEIRDAKTLVALFHLLGRRPGGVRLAEPATGAPNPPAAGPPPAGE
jgi:ADP-ribose pyrophosphatase